MERPILAEAFTRNGEHSHWELRHPDTGDLLWSEESQRYDSSIPVAFIKRGFRGYTGGRMLIIGTGVPDGELFDRVQKSFPEFVREYPMAPGEAFTFAPVKLEPPSVSINEILEIRKQMQNEIFNTPFYAPKLGPSFEELHPEPKKKTYKEPPWKFNKPHNHTSEPYGKSNRSCRTARKRKNKRN